MTHVGVFELRLLATVHLLFFELNRWMIVLRLGDCEAVHGSDDSRGTLQPAVLRAPPVSL